VALGMGLDKRVGKSFLSAGIGYGGSCFPKDLDAFIHISEKLGYNFELLKAVRQVNENQKLVFINKLKSALWVIKDKTIAVLGLSFKPNTDDIRSAPSITIISALESEGAKIRAYDPQAMEKFAQLPKFNQVKMCKDPYECAKGASALLLLTEWDEFKELDFLKLKKLLKRPLIIDGRNNYDPDKLRSLGFSYIGIGRE
jgi:UDPglucose 6-dehydrogenase